MLLLLIIISILQINKNKIYKWPDKTILIGEDEEYNYKFLERVLNDTGVNIIWGANGKEVIDLFNKTIDKSKFIKTYTAKKIAELRGIKYEELSIELKETQRF